VGPNVHSFSPPCRDSCFIRKFGCDHLFRVGHVQTVIDVNLRFSKPQKRTDTDFRMLDKLQTAWQPDSETSENQSQSHRHSIDYLSYSNDEDLESVNSARETAALKLSLIWENHSRLD
jgi:hypothetical protein